MFTNLRRTEKDNSGHSLDRRPLSVHCPSAVRRLSGRCPRSVRRLSAVRWPSAVRPLSFVRSPSAVRSPSIRRCLSAVPLLAIGLLEHENGKFTGFD